MQRGIEIYAVAVVFDSILLHSRFGSVVEPTAKITIKSAFLAISQRSEEFANPPLPTKEGR